MSEHSKKAEGFLFAEGGSLSLKKLEQLLEVKRPELLAALDELATALDGRGLSLVRTDTEATLAVSSETGPSIQKAYEKELGKEIGDAGLEVLAIILYRGASTRAQIDYIRGVNTSSTIRTLLSRGLLERAPNPSDAREYLYRPTTELLAHLGVKNVADLPDHAAIAAELAAFEKQAEVKDDTFGNNHAG